jgi:hypothetical protein
MKKSKTNAMIFGAALILVGVINFSPSSAQTNFAPIDELKTFSDCWGSGASGVSCTNGTAIVYGCQPDPGSTCVGKLRE